MLEVTLVVWTSKHRPGYYSVLNGSGYKLFIYDLKCIEVGITLYLVNSWLGTYIVSYLKKYNNV